MFDIKLQDGDQLHRIITESIEPVTSRRKRLSDFLRHSINTTESKDSWSFNFKHYRFSTENSSTVGVGSVEFPNETVYRHKEILIFFFILEFEGMYPNGDLYTTDDEKQGSYNGVWNEDYFKSKHKGNVDLWVQVWLQCYDQNKTNINAALYRWLLKKEE